MVFKADYRLMQVKGIAKCPNGAFCNTSDLHKQLTAFNVFKTSVLPILIDRFRQGFYMYVCHLKSAAMNIFRFFLFSF